MDPIPGFVMTIVLELRPRYHNKVCIAGSAVLMKYLQDKKDEMGLDKLPKPMARVCHTATNGDVDIFIGTVGDRHMNVTSPVQIMRQFQSLSEHMMTIYDVSVQVVTDSPDHPGQGYHSWDMRMLRGICLVISADVSSHDLHPIRVQFIYISVMPDTSRSWGECVVGSFDIDICKGVMDVAQNGSTWSLTMPTAAIESIAQGKFNYILHPCLMFPQHIFRIEKYLKKGFHLNSMQFHPLCSQEYKHHCMSNFHGYFAYRYGSDFLSSAGMDVWTKMQLARRSIAPLLRNSRVHDMVSQYAAAAENVQQMMSSGQRVARVFPEPEAEEILVEIEHELKRRMALVIAAWIGKIIIRSDSQQL